MTQHELPSTLKRDALERGDEFVRNILKTEIPIPDQEYEKILSFIEDWGVETSWEDMDRILYSALRRPKR